MTDNKGILLLAGIAGLLYLFTKTQGPGITAETFTPTTPAASTPAIIMTPALQAVKEFQETFKIIDTGQDFQGMDILQDNTLTSGPELILQRPGGITYGANAAAMMMGCPMPRVFSFSDHSCRDPVDYCQRFPGDAQCKNGVYQW